ncbi:MAG: hypothetical protein IPL19_32225 [Sandaracinaceae bacterium]|nr:hypothetical protein [Sandaracinaceae bacterium]
MLTSSQRISGRSARHYLMAAALLLLPLVGSGCGDDVDSDAVSADYSPDSAFTLTHPSGAEIAIPAGARTTGLKIIASVPPPSRRPGAAASVGITITPLNPGLTMPATLTLPITPSSVPGGAMVTAVQGTGGVYVPVPSRRVGMALIVETFTFGDFFAVITLPADGGVPPEDLGVSDLGVADLAWTDAGGVPTPAWTTPARWMTPSSAADQSACPDWWTPASSAWADVSGAMMGPVTRAVRTTAAGNGSDAASAEAATASIGLEAQSLPPRSGCTQLSQTATKLRHLRRGNTRPRTPNRASPVEPT